MKIRHALIIGLCMALTGCASTAANGNSEYHEQIDAAPAKSEQTVNENRYAEVTAATYTEEDTAVNNETMGDVAGDPVKDGGSADNGDIAGSSDGVSFDNVGAGSVSDAPSDGGVGDAGDADEADADGDAKDTDDIVTEVTFAPDEPTDTTTSTATAETTAVTTTAKSGDEDLDDADPSETDIYDLDPIADMTSVKVTAAQSDDLEKYDPDFFKKDLFIGDSISTGLSLYNFLPAKNVFAKMGLNPSSVLSKKIETTYGTIGISDMLQRTAPRRVYIMLGSNGIQWLSDAEMITSMGKLVNVIKEKAPDAEVIIVSTPPVTMGYSFQDQISSDEIMKRIEKYNQSLKGFCLANGYVYSDVWSKLIDSNGYFNADYAEKDGLHFKGPAYQIMLRQVQNDTTEVEEKTEKREARKGLVDTDPVDTESDTDETPTEDEQSEEQGAAADVARTAQSIIAIAQSAAGSASTDVTTNTSAEPAADSTGYWTT